MVQNLHNYSAGKTPVTVINVPMFKMFVPRPFPVVTQYLYAGEQWDTILKNLKRLCACRLKGVQTAVIVDVALIYTMLSYFLSFFLKMDSDLILRNTHVRQKFAAAFRKSKRTVIPNFLL